MTDVAKDLAKAATLIEHNKLPFNFLIIDCPSNDTLPHYIPILVDRSVTHLVRICEASFYDASPLSEHGITTLDTIKFQDGGIPDDMQVTTWLDALDSIKLCHEQSKDASTSTKKAIAVHCVSGIGRAPVLVAISLIENGVSPLDAVDYIRKKRRGAFNKTQIQFLDTYKKKKRKRSGGSFMSPSISKLKLQSAGSPLKAFAKMFKRDKQ
jgi:protein tyrosine phosphatase type 4A